MRTWDDEAYYATPIKAVLVGKVSTLCANCNNPISTRAVITCDCSIWDRGKATE